MDFASTIAKVKADLETLHANGDPLPILKDAVELLGKLEPIIAELAKILAAAK